jgi:hypothetical protein
MSGFHNNFLDALFRPAGAGPSITPRPTANAVGCNLSPLRGWDPSTGLSRLLRSTFLDSFLLAP